MTGISTQSIRQLYPLALAEGEGVGTAYEYFAKRLVLRPWLRELPPPRRILVAGLPQIYGASLDFLQLAAEYGAEVVVVDDRPAALGRAKAAVAALQAQDALPGLRPQYVLVDDIGRLSGVAGRFDLALSSEVLQRLVPGRRFGYLQRLRELARTVAVFAPNAANRAHTEISGLGGIALEELDALVQNCPGEHACRLGYLDMPPFPPGITRTAEQRTQASTGFAEAAAMWGLGYYARAERWLPQRLRRSQSHIVYLLVRPPHARATTG